MHQSLVYLEKPYSQEKTATYMGMEANEKAIRVPKAKIPNKNPHYAENKIPLTYKPRKTQP